MTAGGNTISHIKNFRQDSAPPCISVAESGTAPETFANLTRPALRYYFRGLRYGASPLYLPRLYPQLFGPRERIAQLGRAYADQCGVSCPKPS